MPVTEASDDQCLNEWNAVMMIFWRRGLAFLAIPKTGTHAYQACLGGSADILFRHPPNLKHMGLRKFNRQIRPLISNSGRQLETFAILREPIDRLGSWYRYRTNPEFRGNAASTHGMSFEKFLEDCLLPEQPDYAKVGKQTGLVTSDIAPFIVDHLYKYENQHMIQTFLSDRLRVKLDDLQMLNVSPKAELTISRKLRARLEEKFADDFELHAAATG